MAKRRFFAKKLRYRENSLIRPHRYGDGSQGIDTKPIEDELDRRVTTHAKDDANNGDNQFIRGHKRFNDTIQLVDRDPFYNGYVPSSQDTDMDGNIYTDNGKFPAMSLFTKNRLDTNDPDEQIEGRTSYSGIAVSTKTFSGLGEDAMIRNANAGILFSSTKVKDGWDTDVTLRNKGNSVGVGSGDAGGVLLTAHNVTKSIYKIPVNLLPMGSKLLLLLTLESYPISDEDRNNNIYISVNSEGKKETFAEKIAACMDGSKIPSSLLKAVPDNIFIFGECNSSGTLSERNVYSWCHDAYPSTQTLTKLSEALDDMVISEENPTDEYKESKKRSVMYNYLSMLVYTMISKMGSDTTKTLEDILPYESYNYTNVNMHEYRRKFLCGLSTEILDHSHAWEGVFDNDTNKACLDVIRGWFYKDGEDLGKLYEILATLQGTMLNEYLRWLLKTHGFAQEINTPVYDVLNAGIGYVTTEVSSEGDLKENNNRSIEFILSKIDDAISSMTDFWSILVGIFILLIFVYVLIYKLFYMQVSSKENNIQLSGMLSALYKASGGSIAIRGKTYTKNELVTMLLMSSFPWISKLDFGGSNQTEENRKVTAKYQTLLNSTRILVSTVEFLEEAWSDGGIRISGKNGVITVESQSPRSTKVVVKDIDALTAKSIKAENIECETMHNSISALNLVENGFKSVVEVPIGGIVLALPHNMYSSMNLALGSDGVFSQTMTVEVTEETDISKLEHRACVPFKLAQYDISTKSWKASFSPLIQKGTYRLMTSMPYGMLYDKNDFAEGPVLMQKISHDVRLVTDKTTRIALVDNPNYYAKINIYPGTLFTEVVTLSDGSIVQSIKERQATKGVVYRVPSDSDNQSNVGNQFLITGNFVYSAIHFKKSVTGYEIRNFTTGSMYELGPFIKQNSNGGTVVIIDKLEYGLYNPYTGKFIPYYSYDVSSIQSSIFWTCLKDYPSIPASDTRDHYIMAYLENDPITLADCSVMNGKTSPTSWREREPVIPYPNGNLMIGKELGGHLTIYSSSEGTVWDYLNFLTEVFPQFVTDDGLSGKTITIKKVQYVTFSEGGSLTNIFDTVKVSMKPYEEKVDFPKNHHKLNTYGILASDIQNIKNNISSGLFPLGTAQDPFPDSLKNYA